MTLERLDRWAGMVAGWVQMVDATPRLVDCWPRPDARRR